MKAEKFKRYRVFWGLIVGTLLLDQFTKYLVQLAEYHQGGTFLFSLGSFANIVYVRNTGAAWGMMAGSSYVLGVLAIVALLTIYLLRRALGLHTLAMQVAFGLLIAGIAGNMIDRLCLGYVVDFIDLNFGLFRFPAFNIADVGITVGVALYILYSSFPQSLRRFRAQAPQQPQP